MTNENDFDFLVSSENLTQLEQQKVAVNTALVYLVDEDVGDVLEIGVSASVQSSENDSGRAEQQSTVLCRATSEQDSTRRAKELTGPAFRSPRIAYPTSLRDAGSLMSSSRSAPTRVATPIAETRRGCVTMMLVEAPRFSAMAASSTNDGT